MCSKVADVGGCHRRGSVRAMGFWQTVPQERFDFYTLGVLLSVNGPTRPSWRRRRDLICTLKMALHGAMHMQLSIDTVSLRVQLGTARRYGIMAGCTGVMAVESADRRARQTSRRAALAEPSFCRRPVCSGWDYAEGESQPEQTGRVRNASSHHTTPRQWTNS